MARPIPRITAVMTPGRDAGRSTFQMVCQRVAPSAREASSSRTGRERIASSDMDKMVGIIMTARMIAAGRMP
ncbi:hypothetical protein D3C87_2072270 [compost metagenome]